MVGQRHALPALAANLAPAVLLFWFIHRYGIDVPQWDEWMFVPALQQFSEGRLTLPTLFAQHNEHRMLFPRLITLANAALFHWDRRAEMCVSAVLLIACAWLCYRFARAYWNHPLTPLLILPVTWSILSWRQWENLLMGIGTVFTLLLIGTLLSLVLLARARGADRFAWAAVAAAFLASLSSAGGLFLWPVGVLQLLLQRCCADPEDRPRIGLFVVWAGAGALTCCLFFFGYHAHADWPTGPAYVLQHPLAAAQFVSRMLGSPFLDRPWLAEPLGIVVIAAVTWALLRLSRRSDLAAASPMLAILAFALLTALVACDRRLGLGIEQSLVSRYCSLTALGLAALYILVVGIAIRDNRPAAWSVCFALGAVLLGSGMLHVAAWRKEPPMHRAESAMKTYSLMYYDVVSDEALGWLYPDPGVVRELTPFLRAHRYSLFQREIPALPSAYTGDSGTCRINAPAEVHLIRDRAGLRISGWILDRSGQPPPRAFVGIDRRIDVPVLFSAGSAHFTGWVRTSLFTEGDHNLEIKAVSHDGASYLTCGTVHLRVVRGM